MSNRVYVYAHNWVEDYETYGEDIICVSPNLHPPSKEYPNGDGTFDRADYVEVWEDEVCRGCAYTYHHEDSPTDTWNFLPRTEENGEPT